MHTLKSIFLVGVAIGLWLVAPVMGALMGTVALIVIVRYIIKEHADVQRNQQQ